MKSISLLCGLILLSIGGMANNVLLQNLSVLDSDQLQVEISWENSWRLPADLTPGNHDAIWLFGRVQTEGGTWQPLGLSSVSQAHLPAVGLEIEAVSDERGVFIRRNQIGTGDIPFSVLQLELSQALPANYQDVTLFAVEMVYVPEGPFWLGDSSSFHHFRDENGAPYFVGGEAEILSDDISVGADASLAGSIPAAFPKGYQGFYALKYEVSQAQYRDFLNTLDYTQQAARTTASPDAAAGTYALAPSPASAQRNGLVIAISGLAANQPAQYACEGNVDGLYNQPDDAQNRACSYLDWQDQLAYLDWAGLRPMTELEFEKAARGPAYPLRGEFAWGTAAAIDANSLLDDGLPTERVSESATPMAGLASHGYNGPAGPIRVGFGGVGDSGRLALGASYYGIQELSGNLWELCVGVENEAGLIFTGEHGDGSLSADGQANANGWSLQAGGTHRGGAHNSGIFAEFRDLAISDRFYHDLHPTLRRNTTGVRGVRTFSFTETQTDTLATLEIFKGGIGDGYASASLIGGQVGIQAKALPSPLEIWPTRLSPTQALNVQAQNKVDLYLLDYQGQMIKKWALIAGNHQLTLPVMPVGVYFLRSQTQTFKLLLQHE